MGTLQNKIADKFLATLRDGKILDDAKVEEVKKLLTSTKKPKADDFIKIFTTPTDGEVK